VDLESVFDVFKCIKAGFVGLFNKKSRALIRRGGRGHGFNKLNSPPRTDMSSS
jgi:hypothetical protein